MHISKQRCLFLILWLLLFSADSIAQTLDSKLHFDHLTIDEGLSHNSVYCLLQDRLGYIWVGTHNGLNKYDGYGFKVFRSDETPNSSGFYGKFITALFEDSQSNLWVGTRKKGVNIKRKGHDRFENLLEDPAFAPIKGYEISSFYEDHEGFIWITTIGNGILKYDPANNKAQHYTAQTSGLSSDIVFDIVEDGYGSIWVATAGLGIHYLNEEGQFSVIHHNNPGDSNMAGYRKRLFLDGDFLWIGTEGTGLYKMNIQNLELRHYSSDNPAFHINSNTVRDLLKTKSGSLLVGTDGEGLIRLSETTNTIEQLKYQIGENYGLNSNAIICLLEDRTGNIWVGTFNGGVNIYKAEKTWFNFYTPKQIGNEALQNRSILSLYQSKDQKLWIGTDGGGLNWFDQKSNRFSVPPFIADSPILKTSVVKTVFQDSRNRIWIGTFSSGLFVVDPSYNTIVEASQLYPELLEIPNLIVWSMSEGSGNKLWLGLIGSGLLTLDISTGETQLFQANSDQAISENSIMVVHADKDNRIWVGTGDRGLNVWDNVSGQFISYRHSPEDSLSISNDEIRAIFEDSRGQIWIGTEGGGLNQWLGAGKFQQISKLQGLIANSVMGIVEDLKGMLWVTTFEGISRINPENMKIRNFDFHAGANNNQFNQMAILAATDGELFFGGINGLNTIQVDQIKDQSESPNILFTDLKIFNKTVLSGKTASGRTILDQAIEDSESIHLSYKDNSFSIEFAAINYTEPKEHVFKYQLEGFDELWQETSKGQHSVNYTNLSPGQYTFHVRLKDQEASLLIAVKPPYWKTNWFKFLMCLLGTAFISFAVLILIKRREAFHKSRLLQAEREILKLQNDKLESELEVKNSKLMFSAAQMAHKNEIIANVKGALKEESNPARRGLIRMLNKELKNEDYWDEFNVYFNQVDKNFVVALVRQFPKLTQNDIRICTLIRINLSSKEIASLLNITVRGVEQSRYRLKKRLGLKNDDNLVKFITSFNSQA